MQAESLEVLEKASVEPAQARAIVRAIEIEIEIAGAKDTLATKHDLGVLRDEMHQLEARLRVEIGKVGAELHAEIHRAVSGSTRQVCMALLGHMAMTLGFVYFLITQLR